jgi:hypothetical protein
MRRKRMQFKPRATALHEYVDAFVIAAPGGGKTGYILSTYWEKDGKRGGPVVFDADKGGVDATAADMGMGGKIPVFQLESFDHIIYSCTYPEEIINLVHAMPGFEDYEVDIFAWDTLSSMEDDIMGQPKRASSELLPASAGSGLMAKSRNRDDAYAPALADYKGQINRTKAFVRYVRAMKMHTIITCHAVRELAENSEKGLSVREEDKTYGIYPDLVGKNRYTIAKLHDVYMMMEHRGDKRYGYTQPRGGFIGRTRFENHLAAQITEPKFRDLIALNESLRLTAPQP